MTESPFKPALTSQQPHAEAASSGKSPSADSAHDEGGLPLTQSMVENSRVLNSVPTCKHIAENCLIDPMVKHEAFMVANRSKKR